MPPDNAIWSAVSVTPAVPVITPVLVIWPVDTVVAVTETPVSPSIAPALVTPVPVTLVVVPPAVPMAVRALTVTNPPAFTTTLLLLDVMLPVLVVKAPVFCRLTRLPTVAPDATTLAASSVPVFDT